MDWHLTDAQNLAIIDQKIKENSLSPAEYEIARQVIYSTADFGYLSQLHFSPNALGKGAAALAARTEIIVDSPMIQVSIVPLLQQTFCNPVYCCTTVVPQIQLKRTKADWGLETLAKDHPNAIYVIGQDQTALTTLVELIQRKTIEPPLAIATPPIFVEQKMKQSLKQSSTPHIYLNTAKGGAIIAAAIVKSLVNLAWQAYQVNRYQ